MHSTLSVFFGLLVQYLLFIELLFHQLRTIFSSSADTCGILLLHSYFCVLSWCQTFEVSHTRNMADDGADDLAVAPTIV